MKPTKDQLIDAHESLDASGRTDNTFYVSRETYRDLLKEENPFGCCPKWAINGILGLQIKPHRTLRGVEYDSLGTVIDCFCNAPIHVAPYA